MMLTDSRLEVVWRQGLMGTIGSVVSWEQHVALGSFLPFLWMLWCP